MRYKIMGTKSFNGKAIYNPKGKAGEYSEWACNFYNGCSNGCEYCYCKKGILAKTMGGNEPTLKKCFKNEEHALEVFKKELLSNIEQLKEHSLFFSFTTDPMLEDTYYLTMSAVNVCLANDVPVKILTKCTRKVLSVFFGDSVYKDYYKSKKHLIAIGFTLTGHDELEPHAPSNEERIEVMKMLHDEGFKTFASIEPIIDFDSSLRMIERSAPYCSLFKIGLESGKRYFKRELLEFINNVNWIFEDSTKKIYFKDSLLQLAEIDRKNLGAHCVSRDYNLFKSDEV